jgi:hypothetical protein
VRTALLVFAALTALAVAGLGALALAGRGDGEGVIPDRVQRAIPSPRDGAGPREAPAASAARCPAGLPGCREVSGRIVYVERVDPDGDGDAHFVLVDPASVTAPGFTAVDVRADLRPQPLPGVGDHLSAAGAVATGSHGQHQIEAVAVGG